MADQASEAVVLEERRPQPVLTLRGRIPVSELTQAQGERLTALWTYIQQRAFTPAGSPFVRYHTFDEAETDLEVGIPVDERATGEDRIVRGELPGGPAASSWHFGAHDRLADAYGRLAAWLKEHGREPHGAAWESYAWIDSTQQPNPAAWPPPSEWRTQLVQPLK